MTNKPKILVIVGSTYNEETYSKIGRIINGINFLESWSVLIVNHQYYALNSTKGSKEQFQDEKIQELQVSRNQIVFCDQFQHYQIDLGKIYIIADFRLTGLDTDIKFIDNLQFYIEDFTLPFNPELSVEENIENNLNNCEQSLLSRNQEQLCWLNNNSIDAAGVERTSNGNNIFTEETYFDYKELPLIDKFLEQISVIQNDVTLAVLMVCGCYGDGAIGLQTIKENGAMTAVQDPDECDLSINSNCTIDSMPRTALELCSDHEIVTLEDTSDRKTLEEWLQEIRDI